MTASNRFLNFGAHCDIAYLCSNRISAAPQHQHSQHNGSPWLNCLTGPSPTLLPLHGGFPDADGTRLV